VSNGERWEPDPATGEWRPAGTPAGAPTVGLVRGSAGLIGCLTGWLLQWSLGLGGAALHLVTTWIAWKSAGLFAAGMTLVTPVLAELVWAVRLSLLAGTAWNWYVQLLLLYAGLWVVALLLMGAGVALFTKKPGSER